MSKTLWIDTETLSFDAYRPDIIQLAGFIEIDNKIVENERCIGVWVSYIDLEMNTSQNNEENIEAFKQDLTNNEFNALYCIVHKIGTHSGNISIVKMLQETPHSRPVYTNLLAKLDKYNIAKVVNQGVKGTYIEFLCDIKEVTGWV